MKPWAQHPMMAVNHEIRGKIWETLGKEVEGANEIYWRHKKLRARMNCGRKKFLGMLFIYYSFGIKKLVM